jgi:hypothetical protein
MRDSPPHSSPFAPRTPWWQALAVALLGFAVYTNTLRNQLLYDDIPAVVANEAVRSADWARIFTTPSAWSAEYWNRGYRPLTTLSFAVQHHLHGLAPLPLHLANVWLHAAISVVVLLVVRRVSARPPAAFVSAALFAVHPITTEAVASVAGRAELGAALFVLLAVWSDLATPAAARTRRQLAHGLAVLVCFACGLLSKESAATLLPVLLAGDFVVWSECRWRRFGARLRSPRALLYLGLLVVLVASGWWRAQVGADVVPHAWPAMNPLQPLRAPLRIVNATVVAGRGLALLLVPWHLTADYSIGTLPILTTAWDWRFAASVVAVALLGAVAVLTRRRQPAVTWGLAFLLATYSMVSNLLAPVYQMMAERWLYLPAVGFCTAAVHLGAAGLDRVSRRGARRALGGALSALVLVSASMRTVLRNAQWHDPITLWTGALHIAPGSFKAHEGLGIGYAQASRFAEAAAEFERAVQVYPDPLTFTQLGAAYEQLQRFDVALQSYRRALALRPDLADAQRGVARILARIAAPAPTP